MPTLMSSARSGSLPPRSSQSSGCRTSVLTVVRAVVDADRGVRRTQCTCRHPRAGRHGRDPRQPSQLAFTRADTTGDAQTSPGVTPSMLMNASKTASPDSSPSTTSTTPAVTAARSDSCPSAQSSLANAMSRRSASSTADSHWRAVREAATMWSGLTSTGFETAPSPYEMTSRSSLSSDCSSMFSGTIGHSRPAARSSSLMFDQSQ